MKNTYIILAIVVIVILALVAYAYAISDNGVILTKHVNYSITNIIYVFDPANSASVIAMEFDTNKPAANVKISMNGVEHQPTCISMEPFTHWSCDLIGVNINDINSLRVIIQQ